MKEVVFSGLGGQGVLTAGLILCQIATYKGWNATWSPQYGSAMRGGIATCTVKYGEETIYHPLQESPDMLVAMNMEAFTTFEKVVKPGGIVIYNADMVVLPNIVRTDIEYIGIPCITMANEMDYSQGMNTLVMGIVMRKLSEFSKEDGLNGLIDMFRKKGKSKYEEKNKKAYQIGYHFIDH